MLILGKPGGGKGTISGKILQDFPLFHHVSTGDLLRAHVRDQTILGVQAKKFMDSGALVPDDLIIDLVMNEASKVVVERKSLLLDGFPRNISQAISLDKKIKVDIVINLHIPTDTIVERIADRLVFRSLLHWSCHIFSCCSCIHSFIYLF
jgi:adenylate kinase family enzyme